MFTYETTPIKTFDVIFMIEGEEDHRVSLPTKDIEAFIGIIKTCGYDDSTGLHYNLTDSSYDAAGAFYLTFQLA